MAAALWRACARLATLVAFTAPLSAQEPPDTLPPLDSLGVPLPDSLQEVPDSQEDTLQEADSLIFHTLPDLPAGPPGSSGARTWRWDRDALLGTPAFTLLELLEGIPGLVALRFGDYGAPEGVAGPGLTGGRVRVFMDGFEAIPLDGSIPDLSRVSLGALSEVRVEQAAGELRIHLIALRPDDGRPLSLVEAGTGDLQTNLFRGTFLHPRALGGSLGVSIEQFDTFGPGGAEEGARRGIWLRYAIHRGDAAGLAFDMRRSTAELEVDDLDAVPPSATRSDWTLRGRIEPVEGVVAEAYTGQSSLSSDEDGFTPVEGARRQHGVRLGLERGVLWARGEGRLLSGRELPSFRGDVSAGADVPTLGGVAIDWSIDRWAGRTVASRGVRAWTRSLFGLSAFAAWESGARGARHYTPREPLPPDEEEDEDEGADGEDGSEEPDTVPPPPSHHVADLGTIRLGAHVDVGPLTLTGAWIRTDADSLLPLGLLLDRGGEVLPGNEASGFEVAGRLALPVPGFALVGALVQWDQEGVYRPRRAYQGGLAFHDVFYPSGNLEVRAGLQVEGRDPMLLPLFATDDEAGEEGVRTQVRVPFYQSWQAHLQIRVQTVRIFVRMENAFVRRANQDFPDRVLPATRAMYGVRWTLWN